MTGNVESWRFYSSWRPVWSAEKQFVVPGSPRILPDRTATRILTPRGEGIDEDYIDRACPMRTNRVTALPVSEAAIERAISFQIFGAPRTKKNHGRIVTTKGRPRLLPSAQFANWNLGAQIQMIAVRRTVKAPIEFPVNCKAVFYRDANRGDAVGYYQAIADAMEEGGVLVDDVLIRSWDGSRLDKDAANPRVEVTLTAVSE